MGAGHASTSVSYAVGLKEAMRQGIGKDGKVVAVIGDGALTGGVAFEALHNAGGMDLPIVIVVNDNGMSIAPNVGALSRYFNRIRLNPKLHRAREGVETGLTRLPIGIGDRIERIGPQLKESIKALWAPGLFFEELDLAYVGVIDGHDVRALREAIGEALEADRPVVVHAKTVKGKGFAPAEEGGLEGMEKWHAAKPASIVNGAPAPSKPKKTNGARFAEPKPPPQYTTVFGEAMVDECSRDERICGITAAMNSGTGLNILQKAMPERYYDVGIAEQHAVLFAAGMALQGMKPVAAIYSTFLQRGFDQIVHDVCLQNLNVVFAMDRAGPGRRRRPDTPRRLRHRLPAAAAEHRADGAARRGHARAHAAHRHAARRPGRDPLPARRGRGRADPGSAQADRDRPRRGAARGRARGAARLRPRRVAGAEGGRRAEAHDLDVTVADARFAKPIDTELVERLAADHDLLVTIEDGVLPGGFGAAVGEHLLDHGLTADVRLLRLGLPDRYVTHGKPALLRKEVGMEPDQIAERVLQAVLDPHDLLQNA